MTHETSLKEALLADITWRTVPILPGKKVSYQTCDMPLVPNSSEGDVFLVDDLVKTHFVSVHQICRAGYPSAFLAYTENLQERLGLPFDVLSKEIDELRCTNTGLTRRVNAVKNASVTKRLKYLFTKSIGDLA